MGIPADGGEFLRGGNATGANGASGHELQWASRGMRAGIAKGTYAACGWEFQRAPMGHTGMNSNGPQCSMKPEIAMDAKAACGRDCQRLRRGHLRENCQREGSWAAIARGRQRMHAGRNGKNRQRG